MTSFAGIEPAGAALGGVLVLGGRALQQRRTTPKELVGAAAPLLCLFVLVLGIVVKAVVDNGLDDALRHVNLGPNLTYVGSLATLLWRRILHATTPGRSWAPSPGSAW